MKPLAFWVRRFLLVAGAVTLLIIAGKLLRGYALEQVLSESFLWGLAAAAVFTGTGYVNARRGIACALCRATEPSSE
ncbi:MAG: hypothetical protein V4484_15700 [Pseudomonadota bacterium]